MNINIKRELLLPALQRANNVIERRQTIPILSNVLIKCDAQRMSLTASDTEVEVVSFVDLGSTAKKEVALPGRKLFDICRELPEQVDIKLELLADKAKIKSGRSRFTLAISSGTEFPYIGEFDVLHSVNVSANEMKGLIEKTDFAMASQDVRHYLNGLLLEFAPNSIRTVATDGHRLALMEKDKKSDVKSKGQVIIPRKGILEISRLLAGRNKNEEVVLEIGANHLRLSANDAALTTKLLEGNFPDYSKVIPDEGESPIIVDRDTLKGGINRASVLSSDRNPLIRMAFTKGLLTLSGNNHEQEEAVEEIEVEYNGQEMEVGFNVSYLLDILSVIPDPQVRIDINSPDSSCLITNPDKPEIQYVVMPMRI